MNILQSIGTYMSVLSIPKSGMLINSLISTPCLSDVGILGSGVTCKCLKLNCNPWSEGLMHVSVK
jgi:hypothetical protein